MSVHRPRKRFGQHFLADPAVVGAIVSEIMPASGDTIVEIGPGLGVLTRELAPLCRALHAVEVDRDLVARLRGEFGSVTRVSIHEADALAFDYCALGRELRVVGNLPYNISTPLLFHLLEQRNCIRDMHFMLQKEVVERMAAEPGSKRYGRLTVMLGCRFDIESVFDVDRLAFDPPPAVTSAVVRLRPLPPDAYRIRDPGRFAAVVAAAFGQRRKTIRNALRNIAGDADFAAAGIDPGLRAEDIAIARFVELGNRLADRSNAGPVRGALR